MIHIRSGDDLVPLDTSRILEKLQKASKGLVLEFDQQDLVSEVVEGLYDGITTESINNLLIESCGTRVSREPNCSYLAARIRLDILRKKIGESFVGNLEELAKMEEDVQHPWRVQPEMLEWCQRNRTALDSAIDWESESEYTYFGVCTLIYGYLMKKNGEVHELPCYLHMRVAVALNFPNLDDVLTTYKALATKVYTHGTPTLYNAGTVNGQLSSCYLVQMEADSIDGIFNTLAKCAKISKCAGGIGLGISKVRAAGSEIKSSGRRSTGILPMLQVFNATARYVDQGGKRKGSIACYLEPWHADVEILLKMRANHGKEEHRARDLFTAVWVPDLFMERVLAVQTWSLMCPEVCPGLMESFGDDFKQLYEKYESEGKFIRQVDARELWFKILEAQMETGNPYILYKDAINRCNPQMNLGTITQSNLCCEIVQYTGSHEVAVCNLASINLARVVKNKQICWEELGNSVGIACKNLNNVIDRSFNPVANGPSDSQQKHRAIGIGVQGLADCFHQLELPFDSDEARDLNEELFACIYWYALDASCKLAEQYGPYESYPGSPASKGMLQFDLAGQEPSGKWDWAGLKARIAQFGIRNSMLLAPMPTASTSQILGSNECFEPYTSNLYTRRTISGEYICVNKYLVSHLRDLNLWTDQTRRNLVTNNGSVANIAELPAESKERFKTVWEIKQKRIIEMALDRQKYICQSQSMNIHMEDVDFSKLSSMHFFGWKRGLKTGIYYLRTKAAMDAAKFTLTASTKKVADATPAPANENVLVNEQECTMCSG